MLISTRNTKPALRRIVNAAKSQLGVMCGMRGNHAVYEHGQWWVVCGDGATYSVVDANTASGIDFEIVSEPR